FAQADVNTIIALLAPPDERWDFGGPTSTSATRLGAGGTAPSTASAPGGSGSTPTEIVGAGGTAPSTRLARFVMFKVPFEDVLDADTFKALEAAAERQSTDRWRICVRPQRDLLEEGLARDEDEETDTAAKFKTVHIKTARYEANKWGGKYLRAPEIFFTILEKGKGKLVRLGDIAEVRRGFTTGANEFFYLDDETIRHWGIEPEFLKPVIKSPRECRSIVIKPEDLRYKIFMCHKDKSELKGTAALEYIKWGESQKFHLRPTCRGRQRWWDLGIRSKARININYLVDETMRFFLKEDGFFVSDNFQEWHISSDTFWQAGVTANSTVFQLFANIAGRANFGGGLMKIQTYEVAAMQLLSPTTLRAVACRRVLESAGRLELNSADRRALDEVVFDVLGLTQGEREAVYEAVIALVRARLEKARSV
ncbi:MAG: hypothetical protein RMK20_10520, partial [Verrucomicrobiales bacterium]|nr:hypothetical protein [Verrucomicrobiales bacterium]